MPAAAAFSSSSRHRRATNHAGRGGLARSRSQTQSFVCSQRNLGRPSLMEGSRRSSLEGSQGNSMSPKSPPTRKEEKGLAESMPTFTEPRRSLVESLEDSARTNPEPLTDHHEDEEESDTSFNVELRHRTKPQNEEQGRPQNNIQHGETIPTSNNHAANGPAARAKDSLNENTATETMTPLGNHWGLSWLDPFCSFRMLTGKIVNDSRVQNTVLLMIAINSIMMGVATFPFVKTNPDLLDKFERADKIFLVLFTIESSMQLTYYGWTLVKDGFLVFDLLIVVMSWALEGEGTQVFRAFRIFRATRLITRIATLKNLVLALLSVVPKMTAIFMLLMLIFYIFSVMFTQLFKNMYPGGDVAEPYFSTMYDSLFTLFQMMTLDEWADILYQIQSTYWWAWIPFVMFIIITAFVVVNLIIAVICDAVHVLGNENKDGLQGYDSEGIPSGAVDENDMNNMASPVHTTEQRLEKMQQQLDEMVLVQEQMRTKIVVLVKQLRENALKETESLSAAKESEEQTSRSRTFPRPAIGELTQRSRNFPELTDSAGSLDSRTK